MNDGPAKYFRQEGSLQCWAQNAPGTNREEVDPKKPWDDLTPREKCAELEEMFDDVFVHRRWAMGVPADAIKYDDRARQENDEMRTGMMEYLAGDIGGSGPLWDHIPEGGLREWMDDPARDRGRCSGSFVVKHKIDEDLTLMMEAIFEDRDPRIFGRRDVKMRPVMLRDKKSDTCAVFYPNRVLSARFDRENLGARFSTIPLMDEMAKKVVEVMDGAVSFDNARHVVVVVSNSAAFSTMDDFVLAMREPERFVEKIVPTVVEKLKRDYRLYLTKR